MEPIHVTMPAWQRWVYRVAPWLGLLIFVLVAGPVLRPLLATGLIPHGPFLIISALALGASVYAIATMRWYARRVIAECTYDGCTLQFSTVGLTEVEMRPLEELSSIDEWRESTSRFGPAGLVGFQLMFRDGSKLYLPISLANAKELAYRVEGDRWPERRSTL